MLDLPQQLVCYPTFCVAYRKWGGGVVPAYNLAGASSVLGSLNVTKHRFLQRVIYRIVKIMFAGPSSTRFKAWVCGRSPGGIVSLNPTGGMDVYLSVVCC